MGKKEEEAFGRLGRVTEKVTSGAKAVNFHAY